MLLSQFAMILAHTLKTSFLSLSFPVISFWPRWVVTQHAEVWPHDDRSGGCRSENMNPYKRVLS
jgi:hypothetical protein